MTPTSTRGRRRRGAVVRPLRAAALAAAAFVATAGAAAPAGPSPAALLDGLPPPPTSVVEAKARCAKLTGVKYTSATGDGDRALAEASRALAAAEASLTERQRKLATAMPGAEDADAVAGLLEATIAFDERVQAIAEGMLEYGLSGEGKTFADRRAAALSACEEKLASCSRDCLGPTRACVRTVYAVDDAALGAFGRHQASVRADVRRALAEAAGAVDAALGAGGATPAVEARAVDLRLRMVGAVAALVHEAHEMTALVGTSRYLGVEHP